MYVITGATGNTGQAITESLLKAGKKTIVVGRDANKLKHLTDLGGIAAIGDLEDVEFLTKTFEHATAIYAMIPPKWDVQNWREYQNSVGKSIATAIEKNHVKKVIVLSSNGAHLPDGAGPVSGLYDFEQMLQKINGLDILSLRAGYFMQNLFGMIGMIKHMGIIGSSLHHTIKLPIVHTKDISTIAIKHLLSLDFKGMSKVFVPGAADLTMDEVAKTIGNAIGLPDLKYVTFSKEDARAGMIQNGLPATIADGYIELFNCLNVGEYLNDYVRTTENTTPTTLEWFAKNEFAPAFANS